MANFVEAYQAGINAHLSVEQALDEIQAVLTDLDNQLHETTMGQLHVVLGKSPAQMFMGFVQALNTLMAPPDSGEVSESSCLYAVRTDRDERVALCHISLGAMGYPVTLTYGKDVVSCHDQESLEMALEDLLKAPGTGRKLFSLSQTNALPA